MMMVVSVTPAVSTHFLESLHCAIRLMTITPKGNSMGKLHTKPNRDLEVTTPINRTMAHRMNNKLGLERCFFGAPAK